MSEYQYFEFAAIDKPLHEAQVAALRERSMRATISPTSFANHYAWGDLKGDPLDWMRCYFDAHVASDWRAADKNAQRAVASDYDGAALTIADLAEAYTLCATRADFDLALVDFMRRHGTRTALVKRLVEAGLWKKVK